MLVFQFGVVICFWESLASIDLTDLPCWVLLGDFNCISNAQDKLSDSFFFLSPLFHSSIGFCSDSAL